MVTAAGVFVITNSYICVYVLDILILYTPCTSTICLYALYEYGTFGSIPRWDFMAIQINPPDQHALYHPTDQVYYPRGSRSSCIDGADSMP